MTTTVNATVGWTTSLPPKSEVAIVGEKADAALLRLAEMPSSLFTVQEVMWISYWLNKPRFSTSVDFEQTLLADALELERRVTGAPIGVE